MVLSLAPRPFIVLFALVILFFSLIGFLYPWVNTLVFFLCITFVILGTAIKFEFGILAILFELVLGGYGYLFSIQLFDFSLSFRIALFIVVFVFFIRKLIREKKLPRILRTKLRAPFVAITLFCILATIYGFSRNDPKITFFDANAYVALLYIPFFMEAIWRRIHVRRALAILSSAVTALGIVTIAFLGLYAAFHYSPTLSAAISIDEQQFAALQQTNATDGAFIGQRVGFDPGSAHLDFSHVTQTKPETYRWLRDTGTAQISYITGRFFRVFTPSHMFALILLCLVAAKFFFQRKSFTLFISGLLLLLILIISYSRSLWLGAAIGAGILYGSVFLVAKRKFLLFFITILVLSTLAVLGANTTSFSVVSDRITSIINPTAEVAGTHRIELGRAIVEHVKQYPLFGTGFGTTLSFPTILPSGEIIATSFYIFEWSYGDIAVKMGLLGLAAFLWFIIVITIKGFSRNFMRHQPILFGASLACIALGVASITTPIYIHPLGFGALAFLSSLLYTQYEHTNTNSHVE